MKIAVTKSIKEVTPENIGGACLSGKGMTKAEAIQMEKWVKKNKAASKVKQQVSAL